MDQAFQTKAALGNALMVLLKEKSINKIKIKELTDSSGIKRQTFYYHFEDIYALLEWTYREKFTSLLLDYDASTWQDAALMILRFVKENDNICINALQSLGRKQVTRFFYDDFYVIYKRLFREIMNTPDVDDGMIEFASDLIVFASQGYILKWIDTGLTETPEQIVAWFSVFLENSMRSIAMNENNPRYLKSTG